MHTTTINKACRSYPASLIVSLVILTCIGCSNQLAKSVVAPVQPIVTPPSLSLTGPPSIRVNAVTSITAAGTGADKPLDWFVDGILGGNTISGSITATGNYSAPATVTPSGFVSIVCRQSSDPTVTASIKLNLQNPLTVLTSGEILRQGALRFQINIVGNGFVSGAHVVVNGEAYEAKIDSSTSLEVNVSQTLLQTSSAAIQVVNPDPGSTTSEQLQILVPLLPATPTAAARLLDQTTFGPTLAEIQHVESVGLAAYLNEQFTTPMSPVPYLNPAMGEYCNDSNCSIWTLWWKNVLFAPDQLRQRVTFAESHIWSVSTISVDPQWMPAYLNTIAEDSFGNWRTSMKDISLTGAMGTMLNMLNSKYTDGTQIADENFAREILQLFNLGPVLLNDDGSMQIDSSGDPIPTYTLEQVKNFARVFTGWGMNTYTNRYAYELPMIGQDQYHDRGPKVLLNGVNLAPGQTSEQDLDAALDNIFAHPNLPPFIARQMIQQLVQSGPSPQYIQRVASVFKDNGNGVRGDMQAVILAVLMDPEARQDDDPGLLSKNAGRLREPILYTASVLRSLQATPQTKDVRWGWVAIVSQSYVREQPFGAPDVFGFFSPNYTLPNSPIPAPEFQLESLPIIYNNLNNAEAWVHNGYKGYLSIDLTATGQFGVSAAVSPDALLGQLDLVLLHGKMSPQMRSILTEAIRGQDPDTMTRIATYLIISSSAYKVQL